MDFDTEKDLILGNLCSALFLLENDNVLYKFVPEVRINIVYALKNAKDPNEVAAIPGRITTINKKLFIPSYPQFGASDHMARAIIEIMQYDPLKRAGINFKYSKKFHDWAKSYCKKENLTFGIIDRSFEPSSVSIQDGKSMPWKIKKLFESSGNLIPDIFCETAALGKEPLFVITGTSAVNVAIKLKKIADEFYNIEKESF
ncbi:MAG: thiamine-phosphate synthase family protein [Candidatus Helarchaeota archaeon]